jgi:hypothetical protein
VATRIGKAVSDAIAKRRKKTRLAKAGKALKMVGAAAALIGAVAGAAMGTNAVLKNRADAKAKKDTAAQKRAAKAKPKKTGKK